MPEIIVHRDISLCGRVGACVRHLKDVVSRVHTFVEKLFVVSESELQDGVLFLA